MYSKSHSVAVIAIFNPHGLKPVSIVGNYQFIIGLVRLQLYV